MNNTDSNRPGVYLQSPSSHQLLGTFENQILNSHLIKETTTPNGQELKPDIHYSPDFSTDYLPLTTELYPTNFLANSYEHQQFVNPSSLNYFNSNKKLCGFLSSTMNNFTDLDRIDYARINEISNFDQYYQPYQSLKTEHQREANALNHFSSLSRQMDLVNADSNTISQYLQSTQSFNNQMNSNTETRSANSTNSPSCYESTEMKPNDLPIITSASSVPEECDQTTDASKRDDIDFVSNESDSPLKAIKDISTGMDSCSNKDEDIKKEKSIERETDDIERIKSEKSIKSSSKILLFNYPINFFLPCFSSQA